MERVSLKKAARHSAIGVSWRLGVFVIAVLCFKGMLTMRDWEKALAPSDAWANRVSEHTDLEWASVLATVARTPMPQPSYTGEERFYNALLERVKNDDLIWNPKDEARVAAYAKARRDRSATIERQRAATAPIDARRQAKLRELVALRQQIEDASGDEQTKLEARLDAVAKEIVTLNTRRAAIDGAASADLAAADARIKASEEGFRKAFDAEKAHSRPVRGFIASRSPEKALRIADEKDPLHILLLLTWYGLELLIALAIGVIVVPWLISLGEQSDPQSAQSLVTKKVNELLGSVFSRQVVSTAGKALAAMTVGGGVMLGANALAGPREHDALDHHETTHVEKVTERVPRIVVGPAGEAPAFPPEYIEQLKEQSLTLQEQTKLLALVADALKETLRQTSETRSAAATMAMNMTSVAARSNEMAMSLGDMNAATQSIMFTTGWQARYLDDSMKRLQLAAAGTADGVASIASFVDSAAAANTTQHAATRQTTAKRESLRRLNPLATYQVSADAKEIIEKSIINPGTTQAEKVREMLGKMLGQPPMRIWEFQDQLRNNTDVEGQGLLERLMPLVLQETRV